MPFSFNFKVEDEVQSVEFTDSNPDIKDSKQIVWYAAEEKKVTDNHIDKVKRLLSVEKFNLGDFSLKFVNSETVCKDLESREYSGDLSPALISDTDLVPGRYEGGMKIWECSEDLVHFLHNSKHMHFAGLKVLELGCGAALPGIYCLSQGAEVWFSDYNGDVIDEVTIPNALLNKNSNSVARYFCGDWESLEKNILSQEVKDETQKFDLILTSETIYNIENQQKLISIFKNFTKVEGEVLIAAKSYYFGVGGGLKQFGNLLFESELEVESAKKFEDGVKREILKVTLRLL